MRRTQIMLDPWQVEALRSRADREGKSVSALVRQAVSLFLGRRGRKAGASLERIEGVADRPGRYGRDHDKALYGEG